MNVVAPGVTRSNQSLLELTYQDLARMWTSRSMVRQQQLNCKMKEINSLGRGWVASIEGKDSDDAQLFAIPPTPDSVPHLIIPYSMHGCFKMGQQDIEEFVINYVNCTHEVE